MPAPLYGSPSPYPDSPAAFLHSQFQIQTRRNEGRTLSTDIKTYSAPLFESGDFSLFQKQKSDELSVAVGKVLSLFLACIRGFSVLLILRNGDQNPLSRSPNTISVDSVSKYFRIFYSPMSQISSNFRIVLKKTQFFLKTS